MRETNNISLVISANPKPWIFCPCVSAILITLAGCNRSVPIQYKTWAKPIPPYQTEINSPPNAFDGYISAATLVLANPKSEKFLSRTTFFPKQRAEVMLLVDSPIRQVSRATALTCDFKYVQTGIVASHKTTSAWRLIGRGLTWTIDEAIKAKNPDRAITQYLVALRFGFDLTQGAAIETSIGLTLIDEARKSLLPALKTLNVSQLKRIVTGTGFSLKRKSSLERMVQNEASNSKFALQQLQNAFRKDDLQTIQVLIGKSFAEELRQLEKMRSNPSDALAFFSKLNDDIETLEEAETENARLAASKRTSPELKTAKKFKLLSQAILDGIAPMLSLNDSTLARTRILALTAEVYRITRINGRLPKELPKFGKEFILDPFSGYPMGYRLGNQKFLIYSVGADGKDDGGNTDPSSTSPDLTLEQNP